jgi:hypothetical protein
MLNRTMLAVELPFSIDLPRLHLHQGEARVDARMIVLETDAKWHVPPRNAGHGAFDTSFWVLRNCQSAISLEMVPKSNVTDSKAQFADFELELLSHEQ